MTKKEKLLDKKLKDMNENSYNNFNTDIKNWLINCLSLFKIEEIEKFDAYKMYKYVELKESVNNWVSYQGAVMETTILEVAFHYINKEFKNTFEKTRGNW